MIAVVAVAFLLIAFVATELVLGASGAQRLCDALDREPRPWWVPRD